MERYFVCNIDKMTPAAWRFWEINAPTELFKDVLKATLPGAILWAQRMKKDTIVTCVY